MLIKMRYENVPHFRFTCGCMGHAATNCDEEAQDNEIKFGEELRASPPKRRREIMVNQLSMRVVRPLFQGGDYGPRIGATEETRKTEAGRPGEGLTSSFSGQSMHGADVTQDIATSVKGMHVKEDSADDFQGDSMQSRKERVSFGTNMTMNDESSGNDSCMQDEAQTMTAIERFHARKYGTHKGETSKKRPALKVASLVKS
jgi:hypothetical protein